MVPALRGREADTSCGQECEAHGQWGPEEDSGIREHTYPTPGGGCGKVFLLLIVVRARGREGRTLTSHSYPSGHTWNFSCPGPLAEPSPALPALPSLLLARPVLGWVRLEDRGAGTQEAG